MGKKKKQKKIKTKKRPKSKKKAKPKSDIDQKVINKTIYTTILKKGTILYRTQPVNCLKLKKQECTDTGKRGVYFSKGKYVPLGMILEYNKDMYLCKYKLKKDVKLYNGKYIFRDVEAKRYFKSMRDWRQHDFIPNMNPKKSINHIDGGVKGAENYPIPIHYYFVNMADYPRGKEVWDKLDEAEVFLNSPSLVEYISGEFVSVNDAKNIFEDLMKKNNIPLKRYVDAFNKRWFRPDVDPLESRPLFEKIKNLFR